MPSDEGALMRIINKLTILIFELFIRRGVGTTKKKRAWRKEDALDD